ncbi:MAG: LLM class flavin-dependent oxidoreductase, partial [SAR324 cluster bacterium]|nr:LLM class flavin-dependent oxidoreductase [SAR324 cluster bacterium]
NLEELAKDRFILGSPEECYEQLRPFWEDLGIDHFVFRTHWVGMPASDSLASIRLISNELLPELRKI